MRATIAILNFLFSLLESAALLLVAPVILLCSLGLLIFTYKIASDINAQSESQVPPRRREPMTEFEREALANAWAREWLQA